MTVFEGKGIYSSYSGTIELSQPLLVGDLGSLLKMPKKLSENLIVVRQGQILSNDELIHNEDEILFFFAAMGG